MKDTFYFPHDSNAIHDPKCAALINDFGVSGYGFYWLLIEVMHQQNDGKLEKFPKLYEGLAYEFKMTKDEVMKQIEAMLHQYNLLQEDDTHIWSERVLRNLRTRKLKYEIKAESGRIGGIKSGISRRGMKQNEAPLKANEQKERKGKETDKDTPFVVSQKTEKLLKSPLSVPLATKRDGPPEPGKKLTPVQEIVEVWKGLEGVSERPDGEVKAWDRQFFARHASAAKALLGFLGSVETAVECMEDIRGKMVELGRDYSIETVVKWMDRWKQRKMDLAAESRHPARSPNPAPVGRLGVI